MVASVAESGVKANRQDYLEFSTLYVGTFVLSISLTLAVAIFAIPRIYGYNVYWAVPLIVLLVGSVCTSASVPVPPLKAADLGYDPRRAVLYLLILALLTFSKYYGVAFLGGTIVGIAGGLVLVATAHHRRRAAIDGQPATASAGAGPSEPGQSDNEQASAPAKTALRQSVSWLDELTCLCLIVLVVAYFAWLTPDSLIKFVAPKAWTHPSSTGTATPGRQPSPVPRPNTPNRPRPTATFTNVTHGKTEPSRQAPYHLAITFTGLRGRNCLITWHTVYIISDSVNATADTSGSIRTGLLPYDMYNWWIDRLMVSAPSQSRRWGTTFNVYCPDNVLLAKR